MTLKEIEDFTSVKKIALAGVSKQKGKFGNQVYETMKKRGYEVIPINPGADSINGDKCYRSVSEIPEDYKHLVLLTKKDHTNSLVSEAVEKGITSIWIQQKCHTDEALQKAKENNVKAIHGECIFMHTQPTGIHKFHKNIRKLFGSFPK